MGRDTGTSRGSRSTEPRTTADPDDERPRTVDRRTVLRSGAAGAVVGGIALAGCLGGGDENGDSENGNGGNGDEGNGNGENGDEENGDEENGNGKGDEENGDEEDEWIELFNGEDIDDWTPNFSNQEVGVNYLDTFVVEDGLLRVNYDAYEDDWGENGEYGHLFYDEEFSHYMLRVEYRFVGEQVTGGASWEFRNSGVMLHGPQPEEMDFEEEFPDSIELQLLGQAEGNDEERPTGNLVTPGTNVVMDGELYTQHETYSDSSTYPGDQWVTVGAVVRGNEHARHLVEGDGVVISYSEPQLGDEGTTDGEPLDSGTVSLQSESHPIDFRRIELKEIDPEAPIEEGVPEDLF